MADVDTPEPGVAKPKLLKAGELARRTGLTRQSLHQYVLLELLVPVTTTPGGQRLFDATAEDRIALIRNLIAQGYPLREIRDIFYKHNGIPQNPPQERA